MLKAPIPENDTERVEALRSLNILDTSHEERFDRIIRTTALLFKVPISMVSLVDANRQWFKSCVGLPVAETDRDISFCGHAIISKEMLIIEDSLNDPRFADNPLVTGPPHVRFYAGQPLRGPKGHIVGTLCIVDQKPRRLNREKLDALRNLAFWAETELNATQLSTFIKSLADGMILFDEKGVIEVINPAAESIFRARSEELVGTDLETWMPDSCEISSEIGVNSCEGELHARRPDGTSFPVEFSVGEMAWGHSSRYVGIIHDLTEQKETEQKLRELDRLKSEFVSMVSHELRTPLTSIGGYLEMLVDGDAGDINEEQNEYLEIIQRNTKRLSALINDLLDVTRIESGRIELKKQQLDIHEIIQVVSESMRPHIEEKHQTLDVDLPSSLPEIYGDVDRVTQVLINFVSNASKYTPKNGQLAIKVDTRKDFVRISVIDNGIGLSPEELKKLFTRFFRADNLTTREVGGTGLGLWISRSLVEMHGGVVTVESEKKKGSMFSFTLPVNTKL